jgi:glutamyl-tRNA synthetase
MLHIGGARTALYNWAFAKHNNGKFILRIEDTDPERSTEENVRQILRSMEWLGLDWDEGPKVGGDAGPYFQTQRMDIYAEALETLKAKGAVYPCFCTSEELAAKREAARAAKSPNMGYDRTCRGVAPDEAARRIAAGEAHTWRLKIPDARGDITFEDAVYGSVTTPISQLDDFIVARSDGTPTYNFVVCVDDATMGISHVIRGDDHLSNTPKQILVYEALEYDVPQFAHLPMIHGTDGKKLSKRRNSVGVEEYRDAGYLPQALRNYLALLGWSLDGETTLINDSMLVENFSLKHISKNPSIFDVDKLNWMNQEYIKQMGAAAFVDAWAPYLEGVPDAPDVDANRGWYEAIYPLVAERIHTMAEAAPMTAYLFCGDAVPLDDKSVDKCLLKESLRDSAKASLEHARTALDNDALAWQMPDVEDALRGIPEQLDVKPRIVFQALRVAICGNMVSPPLFESIALLKRGDAISRIDNALALLEN